MTTTILQGDCFDVLSTLPDQSVHCCVTSPPYWGLRDYGCEGQLGLEETPEEYVSKMVQVFRQVRRVLKDDGTLWLNLGDSYASSTKGSGGHGKSTLGPNRDLQNIEFQKMNPRTFRSGLTSKQLVGIPWRVAFALQADGWYLRQDIIWHKPNPMPESVKDRCTKAHEYVFLLAKSERYKFDADSIQEASVTSPEMQVAKRNKSPHKGQRDAGMRDTTGGFDKIIKVYDRRNRRSVWTITTKPFKGAHFATMPPDLVEPCILAGCPEGGVVLDPFIGSGTVAAVAHRLGRDAIGIELNPEYIEIARARIAQAARESVTMF